MGVESTLLWDATSSERGIEIKAPWFTGHIPLGLRAPKRGGKQQEILGLVDGNQHVWIKTYKGTRSVISLQRAWDAYGQRDVVSKFVVQPELPVQASSQSAADSRLIELVRDMGMEARAERQATVDTMATIHRKLTNIEAEMRSRTQIMDELNKTLQHVLQRLQPMKEVRDA